MHFTFIFVEKFDPYVKGKLEETNRINFFPNPAKDLYGKTKL